VRFVRRFTSTAGHWNFQWKPSRFALCLDRDGVLEIEFTGVIACSQQLV
jgi:hypothetical protein